jgi:hypothetical protein
MLRHPAGKRMQWGADGGNGSVVDIRDMTLPPTDRLYIDLFAETTPDVVLRQDYLLIKWDTFSIFLTPESAVELVQGIADTLATDRE